MKKIIYAVFLLSFFACAQGNKTNNGKKTIVILSTNDMHAKIDGYAKVAAYINETRKENKNVLLLSGGDLFSGNPAVDQYSDKGYPIIDIMNHIGYQYSAFGNHEFDYGQDVLNRRVAQANFKFLCANVKCLDGAVFKQPEPYTSLTIDGIKICILSTIEVSKSNGRLIPSAHPARLENLEFYRPVETALKYKDLRKKCDLFIALTHNGVDADVELAKKMPEIDLVVGGHSHTRIDTGMLVNTDLITQTECYLNYIGKTTIVFDGKKIASIKNELIPVKKLKDEDAEIKQLIDKYNNSPELKVVVGKANFQFDGKENLGCLMTDAITSVHKLDFAFQNSGGIRIGSLPKGDITLSKVYQLDPFGNEVIVYEMTPAEIRSLIKNSYSNASKRADLMVSGMTYKIKTSDGKATEIEILDKNGNPLNENKKYSVGMNSYISSSYKFNHADAGHSLHTTSAETLIEYLKSQTDGVRPQKHRTEVVM